MTTTRWAGDGVIRPIGVPHESVRRGPAAESLTETLAWAEQLTRVWMRYGRSLMAIVGANCRVESVGRERPPFGRSLIARSGVAVISPRRRQNSTRRRSANAAVHEQLALGVAAADPAGGIHGQNDPP